jgi:hypothetical protein
MKLECVKMKKILFPLVMLASTGVALANPSPYVGANIGITTNTTSNNGNNQAANFRGIPVNLFAGYGGILSQNFYLAGEIFGTLGTGEIDGKGGVKTTYAYGASMIPGVMLSDHTMGFARVGVIRSRFSSVSSYSTGGQFGVGMQSTLTQNVDVRGEYDFGAYRSVGGISSPRQDAFNLGLVYKFD